MTTITTTTTSTITQQQNYDTLHHRSKNNRVITLLPRVVGSISTITTTIYKKSRQSYVSTSSVFSPSSIIISSIYNSIITRTNPETNGSTSYEPSSFLQSSQHKLSTKLLLSMNYLRNYFPGCLFWWIVK